MCVCGCVYLDPHLRVTLYTHTHTHTHTESSSSSTKATAKTLPSCRRMTNASFLPTLESECVCVCVTPCLLPLPIFLIYTYSHTHTYNYRERQDSVFNGFSQTLPEASVVCIHDSARPLVSQEAVLAVRVCVCVCICVRLSLFSDMF